MLQKFLLVSGILILSRRNLRRGNLPMLCLETTYLRSGPHLLIRSLRPCPVGGGLPWPSAPLFLTPLLFSLPIKFCYAGRTRCCPCRCQIVCQHGDPFSWSWRVMGTSVTASSRWWTAWRWQEVVDPGLRRVKVNLRTTPWFLCFFLPNPFLPLPTFRLRSFLFFILLFPVIILSMFVFLILLLQVLFSSLRSLFRPH